VHAVAKEGAAGVREEGQIQAALHRDISQEEPKLQPGRQRFGIHRVVRTGQKQNRVDLIVPI